MKLVSLNCNHCGAPLDVAPTSNFVTCNHCGTRLVVRRTESSAFTEQLDNIDAKQDEMLDRLERIERQTKKDDLDDESRRKVRAFLTKHSDGIMRFSSRVGIVMSGVAVVFGLFWTITAAVMFPPMALFGIVFIGMAIFGGVASFRSIQAVRQALPRYQSDQQAPIDDTTNGEDFR